MHAERRRIAARQLLLVEPQTVQVVGPRLHHDASLREMLRIVVVASDRVRDPVRHLPLDRLRAPTHLVEQGAGSGAKSMRGHLSAIEPQ